LILNNVTTVYGLSNCVSDAGHEEYLEDLLAWSEKEGL